MVKSRSGRPARGCMAAHVFAPVRVCYWTRQLSLCYWTRSKFQVARDLGAKELASVSHCVASFFNVLSSTVRPRLATNPAIRICLPHETLVVRYCTLSLHSVCTCTNLGASHDLRALPTTESGYFEASVVMWHNQRVINTPNHRYIKKHPTKHNTSVGNGEIHFTRAHDKTRSVVWVTWAPRLSTSTTPSRRSLRTRCKRWKHFPPTEGSSLRLGCGVGGWVRLG